MRVASPCSVGWESMSGDERMRHCHSCRLDIYNTAEMTQKEVETLIRNREGRLCIRLYRRYDGTVLTKDCPVGLRAVRKRASKFVSAVFAALLSLVSISYSQSKDSKTNPVPSTNIELTDLESDENELSGTILDPHGAIIAGATIKLYKNNDKKPLKTKSDDNGVFSFRNLAEGTYKTEVTFLGFKKAVYKNVKILNGKRTELKITLDIAGESVVVGIFAEESLIETSSSEIKKVFTRRMIENLPY